MTLGWRDVRHAWRLLGAQPGLAALVVLGIAVGLGTATAAFAIARGLVLAPLPVPDGDRVVFVWDRHRTRGFSVYVDGEELARRRAETRAFEELAGFSSRTVVLEAPGAGAAPLRAAFVSPSAFDVIRVPAAMGRVLVDADVAPAAPPVVVVGHDVWRTRLGGRADVLGTDVRIGGTVRTIVGVMPPGVRLPLREDAWIPSAFDGEADRTTRVIVFGKLRAGVSTRQAEDELGRLMALRATRDNQLGEVRPVVMPFTRGVGGPEQTMILWAAAGILALLLVVAAANVANLVLARNAGRMGEMALRSALGATRAHLVGLLLVESLLLSAAGAILGLAGASAGLVWFESAIASLNGLPWWADIRIDGSVVVFLAVLTWLASVAVGLAPALHVTRATVAGTLRTLGPHLAGIRFGRLSATMIAAEFAIAVAAIGAAGTIGRGLLAFGFDDYRLPGDEVLVSQIYFGQPEMPEGAGREIRRETFRRYAAESMRRLETIGGELASEPGVRLVSCASAFPGNEVEPESIEIEGTGGLASTRVVAIGERYLDVLDAPPVVGRTFSPAEQRDAADVALVNEPFVRRYLSPGASPIGRRVRTVDDDGSTGPWLQIVGVVRDLGVNPGDPTRADAVYVPLAPTTFVRLAVRSAGDPAVLVPRVLELSGRLAPAAQVQTTMTLAAQMDEVAAVFRRIGIALVAVGALALVLSAASLFAIVSLTVTRRTREIGIRVALGASARSVLATVLGRETRHLVLGALAGLGGAVGLMRLLRQIPFDIQPAGFGLTLSFATFMLVVGLAASLLPARRALAIEPMDALRHE
jgi:predicted permease